MATEVIVYICKDAQAAQTAKDFLLASGYANSGIILADQVTNFIYDGSTYDGGANDAAADQWVVIGKK